MNLTNQAVNKEDSSKAHLGLTNAQTTQEAKINQFQSEAIIDQNQIIPNNQQFENQFDQNPPQLQNKKQIPQQKQKQAKISNSIIQNKYPKKSKLLKENSKDKKDSLAMTKGDKKGTINQAFLTQQSRSNNLRVGVLQRKQGIETNQSIVGPMEMERRVKQMAKQIRQKVKRQPKQPQQPNSINKPLNNKPKQLQSSNKIQLRDIVLSPINKPNSISFSPSNLLTFQEESPSSPDTRQVIKDIVNKEILANMWNAIEKQQKIKKYKLKLDPIKHKYPLTIFRKAILQQDKNFCLQEQKKIKEREQKLLKRRLIYNSSRYDRYIKHEKHKKINYEDQNHEIQKSIVLLKRQANGSFLESMENPEEKAKEYKTGLFPTETQGQTIQAQQIPKSPESDNQYNEDFF